MLETRRAASIVRCAARRVARRNFLSSDFRLETALFPRRGMAIVPDVRIARENAQDVNKEININWFIRREK